MVTVVVIRSPPDVTKPVPMPTEASAGELLSQVPPVVASVSWVVELAQIVYEPVIGKVVGPTVTTTGREVNVHAGLLLTTTL